MGALEELLPEIAGIEGIARVRVAYLQPAEMRPALIKAMVQTENVANYFDLSFQHSSGDVLRRMQRFGDTDSFLQLIASIRELAPDAGIRSNIIVGFPGETQADLDELERFLTHARLDAIGIFGYSDEDGTAAVDLPDKVDPDVVRQRVEHFATLADELMSQRAEDRMGERIEVLVEFVGDGVITGRAVHQGPETDGDVTMAYSQQANGRAIVVGDVVSGTVVGNDGADLVAELVG